MSRKRPQTAISFDPGIAHSAACIWVNDVAQELRCLNTNPASKKKRKQETIYKTTDDLRRVEEVMQWGSNLIDEVVPHFIVCEIPLGGGQNAAAVKYLGMVTAIIKHWELINEVECFYVAPSSIKKVYGCGRTGKDPVIQRALKEYPHLNWSTDRKGLRRANHLLEHEADSIAVFRTWRLDQ